jgi:hypothetical protein
LRDLAREYTEDAIAALADVMGDKNTSPDARIRAAEALLNRGWGKPPASVDVSGAVGVGTVNIADAIRQAEARRTDRIGR